MFFSYDHLIARNGSYALIWKLSTGGSKQLKAVSRNQILSLSIPQTCDALINQIPSGKLSTNEVSNKFSLYLLGQLLYGMSIVLERQIYYLELDSKTTYENVRRFKMSNFTEVFPPPSAQRKARKSERVKQIMMEVDEDLHPLHPINSLDFLDNMVRAAPASAITLQEDIGWAKPSLFNEEDELQPFTEKDLLMFNEWQDSRETAGNKENLFSSESSQGAKAEKRGNKRAEKITAESINIGNVPDQMNFFNDFSMVDTNMPPPGAEFEDINIRQDAANIDVLPEIPDVDLSQQVPITPTADEKLPMLLPEQPRSEENLEEFPQLPMSMDVDQTDLRGLEPTKNDDEQLVDVNINVSAVQNNEDLNKTQDIFITPKTTKRLPKLSLENVQRDDDAVTPQRKRRKMNRHLVVDNREEMQLDNKEMIRLRNDDSSLVFEKDHYRIQLPEVSVEELLTVHPRFMTEGHPCRELYRSFKRPTMTFAESCEIDVLAPINRGDKENLYHYISSEQSSESSKQANQIHDPIHDHVIIPEDRVEDKFVLEPLREMNATAGFMRLDSPLRDLPPIDNLNLHDLPEVHLHDIPLQPEEMPPEDFHQKSRLSEIEEHRRRQTMSDMHENTDYRKSILLHSHLEEDESLGRTYGKADILGAYGATGLYEDPYSDRHYTSKTKIIKAVSQEPMKFVDLFPPARTTRKDAAKAFTAVLELLKAQKINAEQDEFYGDITLSAVPAAN